MNEAETKHQIGYDRKVYVLDIIKLLISQKWGVDVFYKYEDMIEHGIEFIISVSKNELIFGMNKKSKNCLSSFFKWKFSMTII